MKRERKDFGEPLEYPYTKLRSFNKLSRLNIVQ